MVVPCEQCPVLAMCKIRERGRTDPIRAVSDVAEYERCMKLGRYLTCTDQDGVNKARVLYDMEPYK